MSMMRAKMDVSRLASIRNAVAEAPNHYMNSHFTGSVFSVIFKQMKGSALEKVMGEDRFDAFLDGVRQDVGIAHILGSPPHPRIMAAMGMTYSVPDLVRACWRDVTTANSPGTMPLPQNGVVAFALFRTAYSHYLKTGNRRSLLVCLRLYRQQKFYLRWADLLAQELVGQGKPRLAAIVLMQRLAWEDSRGSMLAIARKHAEAIAASPAARAVVRDYAACYPNSSVPVFQAFVDGTAQMQNGTSVAPCDPGGGRSDGLDQRVGGLGFDPF
jgi:hypothetical protein